VLSSFDFSALPPAVHDAVLSDAYSFMEQWDSIDVASAAKFGMAYFPERTTRRARASPFSFLETISMVAKTG
jgi:hypothetical protein